MTHEAKHFPFHLEAKLLLIAFVFQFLFSYLLSKQIILDLYIEELLVFSLEFLNLLLVSVILAFCVHIVITKASTILLVHSLELANLLQQRLILLAHRQLVLLE